MTQAEESTSVAPIVVGGGVLNQRIADDYPEVGTGLISYESVISPELHALEREAVFRRSWLIVGRTTQIPKVGSYFTRELDCVDTSIIVVRGKDQKIRAFHNVCPHRGNKLVWEDHPEKEVSGRCATFFCKYHGLGFALDGKIEVLIDPGAWFGSQGRDLKLAQLPLEERYGFLYVNFTPGGPKQSLREYLGEHHWNALEDFPIDLYTRRTVMVGEVRCNWKTLHDAFSEGWHGGVLHKQSMPQVRGTIFRSAMTRLDGPHRTWMTSGMWSDNYFSFDLERVSRGTPVGSLIPPAQPISPPKSGNPDGRADWRAITWSMFPNFQLQLYAPGWLMTHQYWPIAHNKMRYEITQYFQEPRNFSELFGIKAGTAFAADAFLQDTGTLEATQRGLNSRAFDAYPLVDDEIHVRFLHREVDRRIKAYQADPKNYQGGYTV